MLSAHEIIALVAGWLEDCPIVVFAYHDLRGVNELTLEAFSNARDKPHLGGYFKRKHGTDTFETRSICTDIRAIKFSVNNIGHTAFEQFLGEQCVFIHLADGAVVVYKQPRWGRINRDRSDSWMVCDLTYYEDRTQQQRQHERDLGQAIRQPLPKMPVYPLHLRITRERSAGESEVDHRVARYERRAILAKIAGAAAGSVAFSAFLGLYGCLAPIVVAFSGLGIVLLFLPKSVATSFWVTVMVAGGLAGAIPGGALGWDATSRMLHRPDWACFSDFEDRRLGILDIPPYNVLSRHRLRHPRRWGFHLDAADGASRQTVTCWNSFEEGILHLFEHILDF